MATETPASKPTRSRRAKAEPEPEVVIPAAEPDRRLRWAVAFLAAVAVFAAGYLVGHAGGEGEVVVGGGRVVVGDDLSRGPMGDMRFDMPCDMPHHRGGHRHPGAPDRPVPIPDQDTPATTGGYLGIAGVDTPGSVLIVEVVPGSPADDAGITPGDRVISFAGTPVDSMEHLADLVRGTEPGTTVTMVLGGPGGAREVAITVGRRPG